MMRVATFASQQLSLAQQMRTQADWADASIQASSGKKSRDYAGIAADSQRLISLKNMRELSDSYIANIDLTEHRLQGMETSVAQLFQVASDFRTLLVQALNANNGEVAAVNENATALLDEAASLLNVKQDERYLFAGTAIDRPPVDLTGFDPDNPGYNPADPSLANFGYYAGNTAPVSARIDEDVVLDYGITAKETGFEALLRGLHLAKTALAGPGGVDKPRLEQALALAVQAIDEVPDIQARIGAARSRLDDTKSLHLEVQVFADQEISDIENVDIVQTMSRVSALQLQLEASYTVTAQMANVTLINFLR